MAIWKARWPKPGRDSGELAAPAEREPAAGASAGTQAPAPPPSRPAAASAASTDRRSTGQAAEDLALDHLRARGLQLVERNYRLAAGPHRRAGEIDLILREPDGTLVFVEVRVRRSARQGGAAASVGAAKQRRLLLAARHYLLRWDRLPPCRFDVVAIDGDRLHWLRGAFEDSGG